MFVDVREVNRVSVKGTDASSRIVKLETSSRTFCQKVMKHN